MAVQFVGSPPEGHLAYIRDMLGQLADMAHQHGHPRLERSIRHAVQDADIPAPPAPGPISPIAD